jgi:hypothetical protein
MPARHAAPPPKPNPRHDQGTCQHAAADLYALWQQLIPAGPGKATALVKLEDATNAMMSVFHP